MKLMKIENLAEAAAFIAMMNSQPCNHVGYIGTDVHEIKDTLLNDFSDFPLEDSAVCGYDEGELVGFLGLDYDQESKSAELWGPFTSGVDGLSLSLAMFKHLLTKLPGPIEKIYGFFNIQNENGISFMNSLQAARKADQAILSIGKNQYLPVKNADITISELKDEDQAHFISLHDMTFRNSYLNAATILDKQCDKNKVFVAKNTGKLLGYVYCEAVPEFGEGEIHYLAVSQEARNRGVGTSLIQSTLDFLFSFNEINEITLCVEGKSYPAIHAYRRAGFTLKHKLAFFMAEERDWRK